MNLNEQGITAVINGAMQSSDTHSSSHRIFRLKAVLVAVLLTLAGIFFMMFNGWLVNLDLGSWSCVHALPLGEDLNVPVEGLSIIAVVYQ